MRKIGTADLDLQKILPYVIIIVVLMLAPYFLELYYLGILIRLLLWSALAMSWWFFSGVSKYVSLGSAAFVGISLYIVAIFGERFPFPLVILFAGLFCFVIALGIGLATLRLKGIYFAVFTFGLAELFRNLVQWYEITITETRGRYLFVLSPERVYWAVLIVTIIVLVLIHFLKKAKLGLALRLIGENEEAAAHMGVNVSLYKIVGFAISATFMGLVAASYAPRNRYIDPSIAFNPLNSLEPAIMAMLGGIAYLYGPILGAITITLLDEILRTNPDITEYFMGLLGVIVISIVLFMPDGITGLIEKVRTIIKQEGIAGLIERVKKVLRLDGKKEQIKAPETPP